MAYVGINRIELEIGRMIKQVAPYSPDLLKFYAEMERKYKEQNGNEASTQTVDSEERYCDR